MKITFDNQIFNWQSYGGISRYFSRLAGELVVLGQDVKVIAGIHSNYHLSSLPAKVVDGIKVSGYPRYSNRILRSLNQQYAGLKTSMKPPDVIHETYFSQGPSRGHVPRVATVYDMIHELFPDAFPDGDRTSDWKRETLARVDHIISISESTKQDLIKIFGIEERKITVVHLGVDSGFASYSPDSNLKVQRPYLLFVGARGGYKNFNVAVRAIASSKRLLKDFDLIAFGGPPLNSEEIEVVSGLGLSEQQVRHVSGGDDLLARLYSQASALVYPSLYEGFGLPPLEAMVCSCPVVSSNSSSLPEVIGGAAEFFQASECEALSTAIENVVYSPARTEELKALGLDRAKLFTWRECALNSINVYKKISG